MKQTGKCPKCESIEIITDAKVIDRGDNDLHREMSVATFQKSEALIFKGKEETTVSAWVCATCGYIDFYADHPTIIKLPKT
jgi:predicted nucleic-acid-binding Zn-ribbon protein